MTTVLTAGPTAEAMSALIGELRAHLGNDAVLASREEILVYECDGFTIEKNSPDVVVFPRTTEEVSFIVKAANKHGVPLLPRGAGTSLSGGTLAVGGGVMIVLMKMNKIVEVDLRNRCALVEAGVVNVKLTQHLKGTGYHYAPDPSSQGACSIGGNIATNSGGPHTLAYGVTVNHVLGVEVVLADGSIVWFGGPASDRLGVDLVGLFVGCEGTFGICTRAWVRLTPDPHAFRTLRVIFETMDDAAHAITEIISEGIIPAALEMMDGGVLEALEGAFQYGFPLDAEAMLIIEVDGIEAGLDELRDRVSAICNKHHAREVKQALTNDDRLKLWKCRKQAFGAIGRLSSSYCTQDGVVPRTKLPDILKTVRAVSKKYNLRIVNVFHAGDGNIHPIVLFDERDADQVQRVLDASAEILDECLELGGSVTGEHGIGVEKIAFMSRIFDASTLDVMSRVREGFDPESRLALGKLLPSEMNAHLKMCKPGRKASQ